MGLPPLSTGVNESYVSTAGRLSRMPLWREYAVSFAGGGKPHRCHLASISLKGYAAAFAAAASVWGPPLSLLELPLVQDAGSTAGTGCDPALAAATVRACNRGPAEACLLCCCSHGRRHLRPETRPWRALCAPSTGQDAEVRGRTRPEALRRQALLTALRRSRAGMRPPTDDMQHTAEDGGAVAIRIRAAHALCGQCAKSFVQGAARLLWGWIGILLCLSIYRHSKVTQIPRTTTLV